jgi:hypothetical protein
VDPQPSSLLGDWMRSRPRGRLQPFNGHGVIANVYIDGFNLYFAVRGTPYKWLNPAALCSLLLPGDAINRIRYFTAKIEARPSDPDQPQRQQTYIRALKTIPNLTVHYGHFLTKPDRLPLVTPMPGLPRVMEVWRTEEKASDVNIGTYMLVDALDDRHDLAVVISNDSDLLLPIKAARFRLGLGVGVLNPFPNSPSTVLQRAASFHRPIRQGPLSASLFPDVLDDAVGAFRKPAGW